MIEEQNGKQSLIGVRLEGDVPVKETKHGNGFIDTEAIETDTPQPQEWGHYRQGPLEEKVVHGLTRKERVEQSVRVEAALLKSLSSVSSLDPRKHADMILIEVLKAMGGEWKDHIPRFQD